jgi:GDP-L-fucose synthase
MEHLLVTGATGFLGKRVCKKLDERGIKYTKTSLSLGTDLRDRQQTEELFAKVKPKTIIHCASFVGGVQFGMKHPAELFYNNMLMIVNLFETCRKHNVELLVNPISNCAYPGAATVFREEEFWNGPLHNSVMVYGMCRKMSWVGAWAYNKQYNMQVTNVILPNMYGPEDHFDAERSHALGALIMKFVEAKKARAPTVTVWGTGSPVREWLYIDDGAEAMVRAAQKPAHLDIINVGRAKGISIKELAEIIKKETGYEGQIIYDASKPDGAPCKLIEGSKGEAFLNWSPEIGFEEGLRATIQWYGDK